MNLLISDDYVQSLLSKRKERLIIVILTFLNSGVLFGSLCCKANAETMIKMRQVMMTILRMNFFLIFGLVLFWYSFCLQFQNC